MQGHGKAFAKGIGIAIIGSALSFAVIVLFYQIQSSHLVSTLADEGWDDLDDAELDDSLRLRNVFDDLFFLVRECEHTLGQGGAIPELGHLFKNLAESSQDYDQVRFLDASGMEVLRVNWSESSGAERVPPEALQDKSARYYFTESIGLEAERVYASRLDLNVEKGMVEQPIKPMLRLAATVREPSGRVAGVLVLNFLAEHLLKNPNETSLIELDSRGDWMAGTKAEDLWGQQLGHGRSFAAAYPKVWEQIKRSKEMEIKLGESLFQSKRYSLGSQFKDLFAKPEEAPVWYLVSHTEDVPQTSGVEDLRGIILWIAALCSLSWPLGGLVVGRLTWLRDRAFLAVKEAKNEAESANRAKSQFLAAMSHEIRTPMNGVLGMAQILEMSSLDKEQAEFVEIIKSSGDTLLGIIDDILDYSKIEAGRLTIEVIEEDPREIIRKAVQLLDSKAKEKGLSLEMDLDASLPETMLCDPVRVRQILFNLIGNAIKFTESGFVRVNAETTVCENGHSSIHIKVVDSGIGITPEQMEKLFQPFSQADTSITRRFGGTGLGLTISKRLAEMMGGKIEVVSQAGQGSTFSLCLPVTISGAQAEGIATQSAEDKSRLTEGCRAISGQVLIVGDDQVNQMVFSNFLASMNIKADIAEDGKTALAMTREKHYRLVFLDIRMSDMDGYEVADRILAMPRNGVPPTLVAVSASVLPEEQSICFEHGMSAFIAKPVRLERLQEILRECLVDQSMRG